MQHPLENPSLAPYVFVFLFYQKRLKYKPTTGFFVNREKIIAKLWDKCNRASAPRPLPVQTIIHEILPAQASANRIFKSDFTHDDLPYLTRDILVLSSVIQWLGTNVGSCFLECLYHDISRQPSFHPEREFRMKLAKEMRHVDMVAFWTHICTSRCNTVHLFPYGSCYYDSHEVSTRDRAVVDGLMLWLGRNAGRTFVAEYLTRTSKAIDATNKRRWEETRMSSGLLRHVSQSYVIGPPQKGGFIFMLEPLPNRQKTISLKQEIGFFVLVTSFSLSGNRSMLELTKALI
jgi:hypothetical protein